METTMNNMKIGETAKVLRLELPKSAGRRLQDIGLIAGTKVFCALKSPSGDPKAFLIRGAVIAIREEDGAGVVVEKVI